MIRGLIRDIEDFPRQGVRFKDLTPLLAHAEAFAESIRRLVEPFRGQGIACVCGIEARGFVFGAAAARELDCGFVPLRKPGKLPAARVGVDYALEYGADRLEMHVDAVRAGDSVLIVDDVLATGGTLAAAAELVAGTGAQIVGAALVVEIAALGGRTRWAHPAPLHSLVVYD
jgi:adenine phosphoribosyltransferase